MRLSKRGVRDAIADIPDYPSLADIVKGQGTLCKKLGFRPSREKREKYFFT
jgi:hypothetical protein